MKKVIDWGKYLEKAVEVVSEGMVLLRNENNVLPLDKNNEIALFGRMQLHYYKSGTGSGGMVNVSRTVSILDGMLESGLKINSELLAKYKKWDEKNPFDSGTGWGGEPWSQKEMELDIDMVRSIAEKCRTAVVVIARTAGEEQDNKAEKGAYYLSDEEIRMLEKVRAEFKEMIVLLNTGGLIDMNFMDRFWPDAVMCVWQGGMIGGTGIADVLTGKVSPSGKLVDTIAFNIQDYPSHRNFGNLKRNVYAEDIYVGYRYFEMFAKDRVRFPFGFGLSYTKFEINAKDIVYEEGIIDFNISVKNIGKYAGKEVVQLYSESPSGKLGKPARVLCGFEKTPCLEPGESCDIRIAIDISDISSFDDTGASGYKSCFVLEEGEYNFYLGTDVRSALKIYTFTNEKTIVTEKLSSALAPVMNFERVKSEKTEENKYVISYEKVNASGYGEIERRKEDIPAEIEYTGDKGIKLSDVENGTNTLDEFIAQLSDYDLSCMIRGEGMGSPKVTAGTASAFGGVSKELSGYGIPCACCADGPSGLRLDCGTKAFSLPNGTLIASTFNKKLITELYEFLGMEMTVNNVECLLGPGLNIHRHPLNGRNFEYFSEDPLLTGIMAAAELTGLKNSGVTGTIKHFCANNQEAGRHTVDAVISERALREIYLKPFEIAVKKGKADSIMTTYGLVNGLWTASSYDLTTTILRKEWGFDGFVMTDWWANLNERGRGPSKINFAAMAAAQNDVYMVCADGAKNNDNTLHMLEKGILKRGELQRNAKNICAFLMKTNAMKRLTGTLDEVEIINCPEKEAEDKTPVVFYDLDGSLEIPLTDICTSKNTNYCFGLTVKNFGKYSVSITASSTQGELAQMPVTIYSMGTAESVFTWNGTNGEPVTFKTETPMYSRYTNIRLYFAQSGLDMISIRFDFLSS